MVDLESSTVQEWRLRSLELYEEYSQRSIADTIRIRKESFNMADIKAKRELVAKVDEEVDDFCGWLQEVKNLEHVIAHYYSVSLKSLLLGLPVGVQLSTLFDAILDAQFRK